MLRARGAWVAAYDPAGMEKLRCMKGYADTVQLCDDPYQVADNAHALVLVTEWAAFRSLDMPELLRRMARPIFVDGRNLFDPTRMRRLGFQYYGVGR